MTAVMLAGLLLPALVPRDHLYDPGPYVAAVRQSAALPLTPGTTPMQGDLIIRRARIVDVNGARGPTSIRIDAGRITAIGDDVGTGPSELDVAGATVMPGLIDAHVHLSMAPGALTRADDAETSRALRLHHLRAYLASGVTTIFDPAVENVVMQDIHRSLAAGRAGPRYVAVGTPLATPGGYLESLFPPGIHAVDEVAPHLDALMQAGAVGVKMTFERGFVAPVWRLHPPAIEQALIEEARTRGLPIYVHAERADMVRRALVVGPHALVHGPIDGTDALAAEVAAAKIPVISTLALFDVHAVVRHPDQLELPHVRRVVPPAELKTLRDPSQYRQHVFGLFSEVLPFVPGLYRDALAWMATTEVGLRVSDDATRRLGRSAALSIRQLRDAGVPLVMGSDSGNWPLFPYYFHGPTSWRELRLLGEAGLSPLEIIRASTVNPAKMLGWDDRLGTVEVGKIGDLVVVEDDPLTDVERAMHSLRYTIRAGVARSPDGWMASQ
jgi:imidazolonepropionase-like amidohydrolase